MEECVLCTVMAHRAAHRRAFGGVHKAVASGELLFTLSASLYIDAFIAVGSYCSRLSFLSTNSSSR